MSAAHHVRGCLAERLPRAPLRRVQPHGLENQCRERSLGYRVTFVEVNGANRVAIEARIAELVWIVQLSTFGEG